ncbi:MAG: molybdopterin-guanine dinucleotide biosynthesis protein B [Candidatus Odinarchaeota archaeon]
MKLVRVSGFHNSGKTVVVEAIVRGLLERGFTVSTVKDIHVDGWSMDPNENKDTKRHARAGASVVAVMAQEETVIIYPGQQKRLEDLLPHFQTDYLVLEGFRSRKDIPNITCARTDEDIHQLATPTTFGISGLVSEKISGKFTGIPVLNAFRDASLLVDLVEEHGQEIETG